MITEKDLQEAIAECEGQRNPTANTCVKLAAFYTIRDKMYPQEPGDDPPAPVRYSYAAEKTSYDSDTEFMRIAKDIPEKHLMAVIDEVMLTLSVINPRLYAAAIRRLLEN